MEKDCIVWSTRVAVNTPGDEDYFVYTILTRTRSILIIAMFDETIPRYREIVKLFPKDRLMIWDEATEHHYREKILDLPAQKVMA
jgi:DNA helicase-2/ATP-dependent DNA helicase PcrA